jgi:hypothetical protein
MLRIHRTVALGVVAAAGLAAQDDALARDERGYWTRTTSGVLHVSVQPRLRVVSRGRIVLRGGPGTQIAYQVKQRVRARSEEEARRLIGNVYTSVQPGAEWTSFVVNPDSSFNAITELEVNVPRNMLSAWLETTLGGDVEAYDFYGNVRAQTTGRILLDRIRGDVDGRTRGGEIRLGRIAGAVHCVSGGGSVYMEFAGRETDCATAGGNIVVGEAGGPLVLSTDGGNIHVTKAASTVKAFARQGLIEVAEAGGVVTAETSGGLIRVDSARGVKAESAAGMVRVKSTIGPMNVAAAAGSILAELVPGGRIEDSSLMTGGGDITVFIPSNLGVSVMARTNSGRSPRIISDFPEVRANPAGFFQPPVVIQGSINGGGPMLRLNTAGGVIYLKKAK